MAVLESKDLVIQCPSSIHIPDGEITDRFMALVVPQTRRTGHLGVGGVGGGGWAVGPAGRL